MTLTIAILGIIIFVLVFIAGVLKPINDEINEEFFDERLRQEDLNVDRERRGR